VEQYSTVRALREAVQSARRAGKAVGFVPTMGYLHAGHLALCAAARRENEFVVTSIFVNPLQFAPNEDFDRYPRDLVRDLGMLQTAGVDAVFTPSVTEMYPEATQTVVSVPALSQTLEGKTRPTHFQGVATVVLKLLQIVRPDTVYFGQKDGQQVAVVRRLVRDLSVPVTVRVVPTVREPDGLALSSRNVYLEGADRIRARRLSQSLSQARSLLEAGERSGPTVQAELERLLTEDPDIRLDYAAVVNADTLVPLSHIAGPTMLAVAAYVGPARLLDNLMLDVSERAVRDLLPPL
jgi:pantoate--beta-alanine ligase